MASWTGNGSWVSSYVGTLTAVEDSYSIDDNTSVVKVSLLLENNAYNYFRGYTCTGSISIDGSVVKSVSFTGYMEPNRSAQYHSLEFITDEPITIAHSADGTKTISVSATMTTKTGYGSDNAKIGAGTINITGGNLVLTDIPRASTLSAPNIQIGSSGTLTVTKAVTAHVNTITWACAGLTGTVATKSSATSISFTPPTTLYAQIPNATEASITYTITTYASSSATTALGSNTATAKVTVGSSIKPTAPSITLSPVNTNSWLNTKGYYVSGYTKLNVAATASAGSGATLNALAASVAGQSGSFNSGSNWTTPNVISSTGAVTATVTATDSRGRSTSNTASVTFQSYSAPSITTLTAERGTYSGSTWTSDPTGAHIRVTYAVELTLSGNTPSVTVACTGQTSQTATTTTGTKYFTSTTQTSAYTITLTVTDSVGVTATKTTSVSTISVPFNFNTNLPAMGFGKLAESANLVDSAWNMRTMKTDASVAYVRAKNSLGQVDLQISAAGNKGVYSDTSGHWLIYDGTDGHTRITDHVKTRQSSSASSYTLPTNSGQVVYLWASANMTVTIPSGLPIGWYCTVCCGYYYPTIVASGSDVLNVTGATGQLTSVTIPIHYSQIRLFKTGATQIAVDVSTRDYYTAGDTLTQQDMPFASGWVTSSQTELAVFFPLAKPLLGVSGATLNSATFAIRAAAGGYLQYYNGSTYTQMFNVPMQYDSVSFGYRTGGIYIYFTCSSKWGLNSSAVTNNSLVSLTAGSLSITLS